jgi:hypothetical protein
VDSSSAEASDSGTGGTGFSAVYDAVIKPRCLPCHDVGDGSMINIGATAGLLEMGTEQEAYVNLVRAPAAGVSCKNMGLTRVVPGNSQMSLLYLKVESQFAMTATPCGDGMPDDGTKLTQDDIAMLQAWIDDGAKQ